MNRWIVFLGVRPTFVRAFNAAKELGYQVAFVSTSVAELNQAIHLVDSIILTDHLEPESILRSIAQSPLNQHELLFWTLKDQLTGLVAYLNAPRAWGNSFGIETAWVCKNKLELRKKLEGTPFNPEYRLIAAKTLETWNGNGKSWILKPLLGHSSIGVEHIENQTAFFPAAKRSLSTLPLLAEGAVGRPDGSSDEWRDSLLAEAYIDGDEFSLEVFTSQGRTSLIAVCSKTPMSPPFFEEVSYSVPAQLTEGRQSVFEAAAQVIIRAIGLRSGIAHIEIRVNADGDIKVLDIGLRLGGGGLTHSLVEISSGRDLCKAVLAEWLGEDPLLYLTPTKTDTAILYLLQIRKGGTIKHLPTAPAKLADAEVLSCQYFCKEGDKLTGYPHYSGLPGFALIRLDGRGVQSKDKVERIISAATRVFAIDFEVGA